MFDLGLEDCFLQAYADIFAMEEEHEQARHSTDAVIAVDGVVWRFKWVFKLRNKGWSQLRRWVSIDDLRGVPRARVIWDPQQAWRRTSNVGIFDEPGQ